MESQSIDTPWIEKYRPKTLDEVVGNKDIISTLKVLVSSGNIPHFVLSGPPGTGKTTSIMALAHEVLKENFSKATIELNASDDRGMSVVREKIKSFAQQKVILPPNQHKIIILDEADHMTENAQASMRVIISDFSATTRFALACNDSSKIIEAIQSRCTVLRFNRLKDDEILDRLKVIKEKEGFQATEEGLKIIVETCEGDMRNALNNLQSCVMTYDKVNEDNIYKIISIPKTKEIEEIFSQACAYNLMEAVKGINNVMGAGYNLLEIIGVFNRVILNTNRVTEIIKMELLKKVVEYKVRAIEGFDSEIDARSFIAELCEIIKK